MPTSSSSSTRMILADSDTNWVRVPFLVSFGNEFTKTIEAIKYVSGDVPGIEEGTAKNYFNIDYAYNTSVEYLGTSGYTDTRLGANDAVNCIWQFNRDDDIVHPIHQTGGDRLHRIGMGRVYAETTNRNQTVAYFTFGVPVFTNLVDFYTRAFDADVITYNVTGGFGLKNAVTRLFNTVASAAGTIAVLAITLPILPFKWLGDFLSHSKSYRIDRFYDLRTTMHLYYRYVDSILTQWAVGVGLYSDSSNYLPSRDSLPLALQFTGGSIFNIIALRGAIMSSRRTGFVSSDYDWEQDLIKFSTMDPDEFDGTNLSDAGTSGSLDQFPTGLDDVTGGGPGQPLRTDASVWNNNRVDFTEALTNNVLGATQFIGFRINKSVDASESFSNTTGTSPLAEQFNNKVRENMVSMFQTGMGSAEGSHTGISIVDTLANGFHKVLKGASQVFGVSDLAEAVIGNAFIDVPESYRGSEFSKSHSLSFQLRSPYGDVSSIYQTIIVPLSMILAAALPRSGGPYSYLSPFLCRVYVKGMFSVPLGIIDSLSIKRGSSEFGWTYMNLPTCVDVTMSIKDLSPLVYMAMTDATFPDIFGANTSFKEYLLTLSGVGLHERISRFANIKRNTQLAVMNLRNKYFNPMFWASSIGDTNIATAIGTLVPYDLLPNN